MARADRRLNSSSLPSWNWTRLLPWSTLVATAIFGTSRTDIAGKPQVEANRLHDREGGALSVDIGGAEHAGVLLDNWCCAGVSPGVEKSAYRSPRIVAVLLKERSGVDADQRPPHTRVDVGHVLLVQRHVVACAEPAAVAADDVLPRVFERDGRGRDVARNVFGEVGHRDRRPSRVDE